MFSQQWTCIFCAKAFKRSDVLRRHYERCPSRGGQSIPGKLQPGRRKKACDQCAKLKLACDSEFPCEACLSRGVQCSGVRRGVEPNVHDAGATPATQVNHPGFARAAARAPNSSQLVRERKRFPFLLNYLHPKTTSLANTFEVVAPGSHTRNNSQQISRPSHGTDNEEEADNLTFYNDLGQPQPFGTWNLDFGQQLGIDYSGIPEASTLFDMPFTGANNASLPLVGVQPSLWYPSPGVDEFHLSSTASLESIGHALIDDLTHFTTSLPNNDADVAPNTDLARSSSLFLPNKLKYFIDHYIAKWNHHSPVIHRPSFSITGSTLPLLLSVLLTGALLSPNPEDVSRAKRLLNLAERYVFDHRDFRSLLSSPAGSRGFGNFKDLCAVQAAFSIAQLQIRNVSLQKREDARNLRFDQVITACRALGLHCTQKPHYISAIASDQFNWFSFGMIESGIRLMFGIFSLEVTFSIFYNAKPRLLAEEMVLDLPCAIDAYISPTAVDCIKILSDEVYKTPFKLSQVLKLLCQHDNTSVSAFRELDILNLFCIILGFLQLIWRNSEPNVSLMKGLQSWKIAWDHQMSVLSEDQQERFGFSKDAAIDFWYLAVFMVSNGYTRVPGTDQKRRPPMPPAGVYNALKAISTSSWTWGKNLTPFE